VESKIVLEKTVCKCSLFDEPWKTIARVVSFDSFRRVTLRCFVVSYIVLFAHVHFSASCLKTCMRMDNYMVG